MELKQGYQQTEADLIPSDWEIDSIENIAQITTGDKNTQDRVNDGQYPFFVRSQTIERINSYTYDGEAVLTAGDGVGTGKVFHYIKGKFDVHQRVYCISEFKPRMDGYFFYLYFSKYFYNRIMQMTAKSSVDSVRREMIARMLVPIPPLPEQRKIAITLNDMEVFITSLDKLIAKKQQIKQGALQQLTTGKTRLPGFSSKWEVKKLGDLCWSIVDGTHFTPKYVKDGIPFYSVENVTSNNFSNSKLISPVEHAILKKRCNPEKGDILMTRIGSLGETKLIDWDVDASIYVSLALLKPNGSILSEYLYNYTKSCNFKNDVERRALVNAIPPKINMGDIGNIPVLFPSDPNEQLAIATILSDMDAEIITLEQRRDKTVLLKQGMMQELLTGRIRLS